MKLTQFADNVTCFLSSEASLTNLINALSLFTSWLGLKVNTNKTQIICPKYWQEDRSHILGMPIVDKAKILGIWLGLNNSEHYCYKWNYQKQLERISSICESWNHRSLSIKGKTTVANALLISTLQYPTSVSFTPDRVVKEYKKITTDFLWDGKRPKVAHATLIQTIENGGLKLLDLGIRVEVNLLQWVRRIAGKTETYVGKALNHILRTSSMRDYLRYRNPQIRLPPGKHRFYHEMLKVWKRYRNFELENKS